MNHFIAIGMALVSLSPIVFCLPVANDAKNGWKKAETAYFFAAFFLTGITLIAIGFLQG